MLNDSAQLLIVVLAVVLILFLVIVSIVAIKFLQVMSNVKRMAEHAEHMAQNIEDTTAFFKKTAGPMAIFKVLSNIAEFVAKSKRK